MIGYALLLPMSFISFHFMLAISLWVFNCHLQQMNVGLISLTFQDYEWAHVSAATRRSFIIFFSYVYWNFRSHLLMRCSTIVCYLSSKQSLKNCSSDFTGTFIFNILQVEQLFYSSFTLKSIVSIDKTLQS
jgi:hypothetical protein